MNSNLIASRRCNFLALNCKVLRQDSCICSLSFSRRRDVAVPISRESSSQSSKLSRQILYVFLLNTPTIKEVWSSVILVPVDAALTATTVYHGEFNLQQSIAASVINQEENNGGIHSGRMDRYFIGFIHGR